MFVGRDVERGRLETLLAATRKGDGGALIVTGPAGIGKTTLVMRVIEDCEMTVLRASGAPAEQQLSWAALHDVLGPLLSRAEGLPTAQRVALYAALAVDPGEPDRLGVAAATLTLLTAQAQEAPVLVFVDDVHWLDAPSAEALAFAARRLQHDAVAVVMTMRNDEPSTFPAHGLPILELSGLGSDDALTLVRAVQPGLRDSRARELITAAGGHPLALVEMAASLTPEQAVGAVALPDLTPTGTTVESIYRSRLEVLPLPTRTALLVAALAGSGDRVVIDAACAALDVTTADLEPAEVAHLVEVTATGVDFRHPLVRSAVRSLADAPTKRRAHAALAGALVADSDAALWHRAAATIGPAHAVAVDLRALGHRELARATQTAERAFQRAAELTDDDALRGELWLDAATASAQSGSAEQTIAHLDEALPLLADPARRDAATHLRARMDIKRGRPEAAAKLLVQAASEVAERDPSRAASMLADAVEAWLFIGDTDAASAAADLAAQLAPYDDGPLRVETDLRRADVLGWQGRLREASELWRGIAKTVRDTPALRSEPWTRYRAGEAAFSAGDDVEAAEHLRAAIDLARESGAVSAVPYMAVVHIWTLCRLGELDTAASVAADALALSDALGNVSDEAWAMAAMAWVDAHVGDELACRRHAAESEQLARSLGMVGIEASAPALGLLELSHGRYNAAMEHLGPAVAEHDRRGSGDVGAPRMLAPLLVEALVRAGRGEEAAARAAVLAKQAEAMGTAAARAAVERCRGLLAPDDEAERHFQSALALHQEAGHPFELARTQLCFGERLRRMRRRSDARVQLRAAEAAFDGVGAALWRARAWDELAATGERRSTEAGTDRLTPQEAQIARLVATGLTNREVAGQLFLSEKTIETHLGRVFRKLGLRSRTALAASLTADQSREIPDSTGSARA